MRQEVEESTIAKSWSELLIVPDVQEDEATDASVEIDAVMDELMFRLKKDRIGLASKIMTQATTNTLTKN